MDFINSLPLRALLFLSAALVVVVAVHSGQDPEMVVEASKVERAITTSKAQIIKHKIETRKPDGSVVIETTTKKDMAKVVDKSAESHISVRQSASKSSYRLGLDYLPSIGSPPSPSDVAIRAGARLGDSPVWVEAEIDLKHEQGSIGVSAEF